MQGRVIAYINSPQNPSVPTDIEGTKNQV